MTVPSSLVCICVCADGAIPTKAFARWMFEECQTSSVCLCASVRAC